MNPSQLSSHLSELADEPARHSIVAGFDAFVDDLLHVVDSRTTPEAYTPIPTIAGFADWTAGCAGRSGLRECVLIETAAGGCTPNLGDGIATLGFPLHAFAGVGLPQDPAFDEFSDKCASLDSLGMQPGRTAAYEFHDGKLMLCSFSHFAKFTPALLRERLAASRYAERVRVASAIVFTSWSVYPHMTECWRFLQSEVLAELSHRLRIFLDLADPASRTPADLREMVGALAGFEAIGPTTLSLNGNEANQIALALSLEPAGQEPGEVRRLASEIRKIARISEVGIHLIKFAVSAVFDGTFHVSGPHCERPKKSVGAGDRFNAGWLAGALLGLADTERLLLGVAVSGFFVRHARSGNFSEILRFLHDWHGGTIDVPVAEKH